MVGARVAGEDDEVVTVVAELDCFFDGWTDEEEFLLQLFTAGYCVAEAFACTVREEDGLVVGFEEDHL